MRFRSELYKEQRHLLISRRSLLTINQYINFYTDVCCAVVCCQCCLLLREELQISVSHIYPINNRRQRLGGAQMSVTFNASYWLPASRGLSHTIEGVNKLLWCGPTFTWVLSNRVFSEIKIEWTSLCNITYKASESLIWNNKVRNREKRFLKAYNLIIYL